MLSQQKARSLKSRVDDYLHVSTKGYEVEELGGASTEAILDELTEAEVQLARLQRRISRLRQLLASMGSAS